jgi:FtsP/CotA-like multicopper oxidase with cupredoxin domain
MMTKFTLTRRGFVLGALGTGLAALGARAAQMVHAAPSTPVAHHAGPEGPHSDAVFGTVGTVDHTRNGFDPVALLSDFYYGDRVTTENGRTVREYTIIAVDKEIEIARVFFPAWTYNGRVPGPTVRATAGDLLRIRFINAGSHPHTMHFHGVHRASMDGVAHAGPHAQMLPPDMIGPGQIAPGAEFTYEFEAEPFGCHLYHCHALPLKRHIYKGLYGAFIIDPPGGRPPAREMVMVMNAFDTDFDGENEVYAVNSIAFAYQQQPIPVKIGELVRIYLVNITEFDPINSFHLHAEFFDYDHGTTPSRCAYHTVMQCQGQRGILEFRYRYPGLYMFHAHQSEFADLGWMGMFYVTEEGKAHGAH